MTALYEQWVWLEEEPDGKSGMIAAAAPQMGNTLIPLAARTEALARQLGSIARLHGERTGRRVRLVHMREIPE